MKRMSIGDRAVTIVNYIFCFIAACITAYPAYLCVQYVDQ